MVADQEMPLKRHKKDAEDDSKTNLEKNGGTWVFKVPVKKLFFSDGTSHLSNESEAINRELQSCLIEELP